jgi:hypothetical protein
VADTDAPERVLFISKRVTGWTQSPDIRPQLNGWFIVCCGVTALTRNPEGRSVKTKGEIEAAICEAFTRFERDYMGRGPKDIHTHLLAENGENHINSHFILAILNQFQNHLQVIERYRFFKVVVKATHLCLESVKRHREASDSDKSDVLQI